MKAKDIIRIVRQAIGDVKRQNQAVVSIDALENYLSVLERHVGDVDEADHRKLETELVLFRAEHERNLAHYEAQQTHSVEMLRSVVGYGRAALNSAMLINGGAAVALLAFIGNIWTKGTMQPTIDAITSALVLFAYGVLLAAIGTAGSYFTQYFYHQRFQRTGVVFHTITALLVVASYVLFGIGVFESYSAFTTHLAPEPMLQPTQ